MPQLDFVCFFGTPAPLFLVLFSLAFFSGAKLSPLFLGKNFSLESLKVHLRRYRRMITLVVGQPAKSLSLQKKIEGPRGILQWLLRRKN